MQDQMEREAYFSFILSPLYSSVWLCFFGLQQERVQMGRICCD